MVTDAACEDAQVRTREVLVALGMARHLPADLCVDLGMLHPTQHSAMQLNLTLDGEIISAADPRIGFMHRSDEKIFESLDYRQLLMLASRHDWVNAFHAELNIALLLEDAMGITPSERSTWSRTLLAELDRITTGLLMLGATSTNLPQAIQAREGLVHLHEQLTGTRLHPMFVRIGGIAHELPLDWLAALETELDSLQLLLPALHSQVEEEFAHLTGIGIITGEQVHQFGLSGNAARASGITMDLRIQQPYLAYAQVSVPMQFGQVGDIPSRLRLLVEQLQSSMEIIRAAASWLREAGPGTVNTPLPKVVRVPEGTSYLAIEGPLGVLGALLDSAGDKTPWRLKLRTPSFAMVQSLTSTLIGLPLEHLGVMLQSCTFVVGDADR